MYDIVDVQDLGSQYGYQQVQREDYEGVLGFSRPSYDGNRELVRVWWRTGTVGTYLTHPRQGKSPLFRRDVHTHNQLECIFENPRVHTGVGYHRRPEPNKQERTVPCPGCGRMYTTMIGSVSHFESGSCPACPGRENARRTAYNFARKHDTGGNFTGSGVQRIGYYSDEDDWQSDGNNYHCNSCGKQFRLLNSMMQHQRSRAQCRPAYNGTLRLGY